MSKAMDVLLVDDDEPTANQLGKLIQERLPGAVVRIEHTATGARNKLKEYGHFDAVILDASLPEEKVTGPANIIIGYRLARDVRSNDPKALVCYITAYKHEVRDAFSELLEGDNPYSCFVPKEGPRWGTRVIERLLEKRIVLLENDVFRRSETKPLGLQRSDAISGECVSSNLAALIGLLESFYEGKDKGYWSEELIRAVESAVEGRFDKRRNDDGTYYVWLNGKDDAAQETPSLV